jgi:hypothetical protein
MYIHMLGYATHFGQMETLKLIAANGFPEKVRVLAVQLRHKVVHGHVGSGCLDAVLPCAISRAAQHSRAARCSCTAEQRQMQTS